MRKRILLWLLKRALYILDNSPDLKKEFIKRGNEIIDIPDWLGFDEEREARLLNWIWDNGMKNVIAIVKRYL